MNPLLHLIQSHPVYAVLGGYVLFSNFVGALPTPDEHSGQLYRFVYRFGHGVASNLKYAFKAKFPQYVDPGDGGQK